MFKNLNAEMARKDLNGKIVALGIGMTEKTFSNKKLGKSEFTRSEMLKIKRVFFNDLTLEYLFESTEDEVADKTA